MHIRMIVPDDFKGLSRFKGYWSRLPVVQVADRGGTTIHLVGLTLFIKWTVKPFTTYVIAAFFLGTLFLGFIGPDAVDHVKLPLGVELNVGNQYGAGDVILSNPLMILWIAIPLFIRTMLIVGLGYLLSKVMGLTYENAAPTAMIGASNRFEVAIATAVMLYGLSSGAALATVVGVLIEVPVMLILVRFCIRTKNWFAHESHTHVEPQNASR